MTDLKEADNILKEYTEPNSLIDNGNLFFAATKYKKAVEERDLKILQLIVHYNNLEEDYNARKKELGK